MSKSRRRYYKVRIRDSSGMKVNKTFLANGSQDAANKYKGDGSVMWVRKMGRGRLADDVVAYTPHDIDRIMTDLRAIAKSQVSRQQEVLKDIREHAQEVSGFIFMGNDIVREIKQRRKERIERKGGYDDNQ